VPGSPLPVLYVHYGSDWIRGSERALLDLLAHVDRARVTPIVWSNSAPLVAAVDALLGIPAVHQPFSILFGWDAPRFALAHYRRLVRDGRRLIERHGARVVHANSGAPVQWMLPAARSARIPILAHLHAAYPPRDRLTLGLHQVALAAGVSQPTVAGLLADGMPADRVTIVPNGIDIARLGMGSAKTLRAELGIPDSAPTITAIGSLIPRKGFDILLRAMPTIPDAHLLIVGDGPARAELHALTDNARIHWLGERPDAGAILRDATTIAVSAARDEAFGLTLIEAGAFARPIVATCVGGVPEVVTDSETGVLVPPEDPTALANAIRYLIDHPADAARLGAAARARVERDFTIGRVATTFATLYERLAAGDPATYGWRAPWTSTPGLWRHAWHAALRRLSPDTTPRTPRP
jgi:L-malate glycosyltransferase